MNPFEPHTGNALEATPRNTKKQEKNPQVVLFMSHLIIISLQSDALLKKLLPSSFYPYLYNYEGVLKYNIRIT